MDQYTYLTWDNNLILWDDTESYGKYHFTWDQVRLIQNVQAALNGGGWSPTNPFERIREKLPEEEVKKFIKVVCEVNGRICTEKKYKHIESKITVNEIKKTIDTVLRVQVNTDK